MQGANFLVVLPSQPAQMSFLGIGAPEAILVGIVALVVFGPKGLAEVSHEPMIPFRLTHDIQEDF